MRKEIVKINVEMTKQLRPSISYQRPSAQTHACASKVVEIVVRVYQWLGFCDDKAGLDER